MSKIYLKRQNLVQNKNIDVQNLENIGSPIWCFSLGFFSALCDFFEIFWIPPKGLLRLFRYFATQWMSKNPKGSPFYIFWRCDTVQKSHFKFFFGSFAKISQGSPLIFSYFATNWSFTKPKGSPFYNFER